MKPDGRGFCRGLGPAPGSCPWCERFHLLVDVRQPDSSRPWIKTVWAGRLRGQSPVSGRLCCSAQHEMHYLLFIQRATRLVLVLLLLLLLSLSRANGPTQYKPDSDFSLQLSLMWCISTDLCLCLTLTSSV